MNVYFKRFVICLCICCSLVMFARPQRANAIIPLVGYVAIGGVLIATSTIVSIMIKAGDYSGYDIVSEYDGDIKTYLTNKILSLSAIELLKYFATSEDTSGQVYVEMTSEGYSWNKTDWDAISAGLKEFHDFERSLSTQVTSVVAPSSSVNFMLNNYYMTPYSYISNIGHVYTSFIVPAGDTLHWQKYQSGSSFSSSLVCSVDTFYRVIQLTSTSWCRQYSLDGITWVTDGGSSYFSSGYIAFGYYTTSNTVYIPSTNITKPGIEEGVATGSTVAYPISGQYSVDAQSNVYDGIDGATAGVISGLTTKDLSTTGEGVGEGTASNTLTQEGVKDAVREGIDASSVGDLDIPNSDVPTLDFSPLYYDVSKKFPFCVPFDFINLLSPLKSEAQIPSFHVEFDPRYFKGGGSFDFDFSRFDKLVKVVRYFILLAFVYYLIRKIRAFIGAGGGA